MKQSIVLTIASLIAVVLMAVHMTDDIVRGMEPGTLFDLVIVPILAVWLYAALVLIERRSGLIIILIESVLALVIPIVHMKGAGVGTVAKSGGGFFFVGILFALAVTALFCAMLAVRGLWELRREAA